jgi:alpha/beta superfamily hydrolase
MTRHSPIAESLLLQGGAGPVEALLEKPPGAREDIIAVCCHPHPLYGGTMQNKVVHTLARACHDVGVASLRFNFRGVGASGGKHDHGEGESEDAAWLADWARRERGYRAIWSLGFSFGAWVAFRLATLRDAGLLVTVAPPVQRVDFSRHAAPSCRWLVVQGDADELVNHEAVLGWTRAVSPAPEVMMVAGAEHFFHGRLTELRARVGAWLAARLPGA